MSNQLDRDLSVQVFNQGQELCRESLIDCGSYHFMRPTLRRIGAVPSPYSHQEFYRDAIARVLAVSDVADVTISGTADYAWLLEESPLLKELGNAGASAQIHVVDGCPTPASFSLLAGAETKQHTVDMKLRNIAVALSNEQVSDLIVTDAFLTQFSDRNDRLAVLAQWRKALKLGAHIVTTAQIAGEQSAAKPAAENAFVNNTAALYAKSEYPELLQLGVTEFIPRIRNYATPNASRVYASERELRDEIDHAGLKVADMMPMTLYSHSSEKTLHYRGVVMTTS